MSTLNTLPTLDGTVEAAVRRLEAWSTEPIRKRMAGQSPRYQTAGERHDQLLMLDLTEVTW